MKSFSFPFICLNDVEIEQPLFGANYIRGKVRAQPDGNFIGEAKFKLVFKSGGCIEFAQAALRAAHMAQQNAHGAEPPPYTPPQGKKKCIFFVEKGRNFQVFVEKMTIFTFFFVFVTGDWHQAPPPAYTPTPGFYGWLPNSVFPNNPDPSQVYMHDSPPPYPGISESTKTYILFIQIYVIGVCFPDPPPAYGGYQQPPAYNQPGYPPQSGGYPQPQGGNGYPQPNAGYPGYPAAGGYPSQPNNMYPQVPQQVPNAAPYGNSTPSSEFVF